MLISISLNDNNDKSLHHNFVVERSKLMQIYLQKEINIDQSIYMSEQWKSFLQTIALPAEN
jgi:hypothetical protein